MQEGTRREVRDEHGTSPLTFLPGAMSLAIAKSWYESAQTHMGTRFAAGPPETVTSHIVVQRVPCEVEVPPEVTVPLLDVRESFLASSREPRSLTNFLDGVMLQNPSLNMFLVALPAQDTRELASAFSQHGPPPKAAKEISYYARAQAGLYVSWGSVRVRVRVALGLR